MMKKVKPGSVSFWLFITATFVASPIFAQTPAPKGFNNAYDQLVASKVQVYYSGIKDFKAGFQHIYTKAYHAKERPRYGYLWVKKPGKMYWRYDSPQKRMFVCDGKRVWIYTPGDKQVLWRNVQRSQLPSAVKFLWGAGNILAEFHVKVIKSKYGRAGSIVLKLVPRRTTSHYTHILFVLKDMGRQAVVTESIVYDSLGNKNHYIFNNTQLNTRIPDNRFVFTPPRGVRVIEATDQKSMKP